MYSCCLPMSQNSLKIYIFFSKFGQNQEMALSKTYLAPILKQYNISFFVFWNMVVISVHIYGVEIIY